MSAIDERTGALATACGADLGEPSLWVDPLEWREALALCVIESVQTTRSHYTSVRNVVERYDAYRDGAASSDGITALLASFDQLGSPAAWADLIGNRKPVSTRPGAQLKAAAIHAAAQALGNFGIESSHDLRAALAADADPIRAAWFAIPGQSSGITWRYLAIQIGATPPSSDPFVLRYVGRTACVPDLGADECAALIDAAAAEHGVEPDRLGYAIWRKESGRPVARSER